VPTVVTMARGQPINTSSIVPIVGPTGALLGAQALASGCDVPTVVTMARDNQSILVALCR
jgi:hypothetical protein